MSVIIDGYEYVTNAPKGAALFDRVAPGWADRIDLDALEMSSIFNCAVTQLYGDYKDGLKVLFPDNDRLYGDPEHPSYVHGFDRHVDTPREIRWGTFQAEWVLLIQARKTS